ncbi:MAG: hypothetical protein ABSF45_23840 [Terriglobia bacterium]
MKTCRFCLSDDLPDAATHCKHCGKRVQPRLSSQDQKALTLALVIVIGLFGTFYAALQSQKHEDARAKARELVDALRFVCASDTPAEIADDVSAKTQAAIGQLDLEPEELIVFQASVDSRLVLLR